MAEDTPSDVIDIHNKMVLRLSQSISGQGFEELKNLFLHDPLTLVDVTEIHNVQGLFRRLQENMFIDYGDYNKVVSKLQSFRPDLCEIIKKRTEEICRKRDQKDTRDLVISMDKPKYHASEGSTAYVACTVDPKPDSVTWKKGQKESPPPSERIPIDNRKFFSGCPKAPTLVIKESTKLGDEGHYQCSAEANSQVKYGDIVHLEVSAGEETTTRPSERVRNNEDPSRSGSPPPPGNDLNQQKNNNRESRKDNKWGGQQSRTRSSSRARKSKTGTKNKSRQIRSYSQVPESVVTGTGACGLECDYFFIECRSHSTSMRLRTSFIEQFATDVHADRGCRLSYIIQNEIDTGRPEVVTSISNGFAAATNENGRVQRVRFEPQCILVCIEISAASSQSEPSSVFLAEEFRHYILNGGHIQLWDESCTILDIDETSFKITPRNACQDGLPYVKISHGRFVVPAGESAILQTYIIAPPGSASIRWFKIERDHQIPIEIDNKKYFGGSYLSPTLIIRDANTDDHGLYLCWATNDFGTGSSNTSLLSIQSGCHIKAKSKKTLETIAASELDADSQMAGRTEASTDDPFTEKPKPYTKTTSEHRPSDRQKSKTAKTNTSGVLPVLNVDKGWHLKAKSKNTLETIAASERDADSQTAGRTEATTDDPSTEKPTPYTKTTSEHRYSDRQKSKTARTNTSGVLPVLNVDKDYPTKVGIVKPLNLLTPPDDSHRASWIQVATERKDDPAEMASNDTRKTHSDQDTRDTLRIVMIGTTGTGKSATGNSLIGDKVLMTSPSRKSVTKECSVAETERFDTKLVVVDTPVILDDTMSDNEFKNQFIECTQLASPGVHAFLYCMKIGQRNRENKDTRAFSMITRLLGQGFLSHAIVVITGRDMLEEDDRHIEEYLSTLQEECKRFINSCSGGVVAVSNFGTAAKAQAAEQIINRVRELVQRNGGMSSCYRNILFDETNREINRRMEISLRRTNITRPMARLQAIRDIKEKNDRNISLGAAVAGAAGFAGFAGIAAVGGGAGTAVVLAGTLALAVLSKFR